MKTQEELIEIIENSEIGRLLYDEYNLSAFNLIDKLAEKIYKEILK